MYGGDYEIIRVVHVTNQVIMEIADNGAVKKLNTWLSIDVFESLTHFAKVYAKTGLGGFDYNTAIRILLMKSGYADSILDIDKRLRLIENNNQISENPQIPKGYREVITLADRKKKEVE